MKIKGVEGYFWLGTDTYEQAGIYDVLYLLLYLLKEVQRRARKLLGFISAQDGEISTKDAMARILWHFGPYRVVFDDGRGLHLGTNILQFGFGS